MTYLENDLRRQAGQAGYSQSFVEHYLLAINAAAWLVLWRKRQRKSSSQPS